MILIVIKLGNTVYNGDEENEEYKLLRFLNTIMYLHKDDFMGTVSEYIDFSDNDELCEEVIHESTIEQIKYEGMREELTAELTEELTGRGIEVLLLNNLAEQIFKSIIILRKRKLCSIMRNLLQEIQISYLYSDG